MFLWLLLGITVPSIHQDLLLLGELNVVIDHHLHELLEPNLGLPLEHLPRLGGVPLEAVDFCRPEVLLVNDHVILPAEAGVAEGSLQELLDGVGLLSGDDVIPRLFLLQHEPHCLDVVPREPPVPGGREVAEEDPGLQPDLDAADGARDLARDEVLAAARGLVVEEHAVAGEYAVGLAVVDGVPVRGDLGGGVGRARVEGRVLALRRRRGAEHLRGTGLVVAHGLARQADGLEEAERPRGGDVGGVVGDLEGDGDVRLRGEVVDLVGGDGVERAAEGRGVGQVGVVEPHRGTRGRRHRVRVVVDVVQPLRVEVGGAADEAVHLVSLGQEQLREVAPVLPRDARDQRHLPRRREGPRHRGGLVVHVAAAGSGSGGRAVGMSHLRSEEGD
uniref:Uncharacterized protein n=1 Tax=Zea mays TaxID=4577 RepID=A0A804PTD2_MAIZE